MVTANSQISADAAITGQLLRLSVSVLPANGSASSGRFRDIRLEALVGEYEQRYAVVHGNITEMWGDIIADEVRGVAVSAVGAALDRSGISYIA